MKHFLPVVFCAAVLALPLQAAEPGPNVQIPQGGTLRGRFIEEHSMKNPHAPLRSEGHFLLVPGSGMIWSVEKPLPITLIVTSNGLTQKLGNIPLPRVSTEKMPILARATDMLSAALMGKWQKLDHDFVVTRGATPQGWEAIMTARPEANIPFKSITAEGAQFVNAAIVTRNDDGTENLAFSDQSVSPEPPTPAEKAAFAEANAQPH